MSEKYCKDCRFFNDSWGANCTHPELQHPNPVHGPQDSNPTWNRAQKERCGPEGRHFEDRWSVLKHIKSLMAR